MTRTNALGLALIPHLRAYQKNPVGIDQADLPLDAEVTSLQLKLTPALRSGVVVDFPVRRSRSASFRLAGEDGMALPPGAVVQLEGDLREFPVGFDGRVFVTGLGLHNRLLGEWAGRPCHAEFVLGDPSEPLPDLGTLICKGTTP